MTSAFDTEMTSFGLIRMFCSGLVAWVIFWRLTSATLNALVTSVVAVASGIGPFTGQYVHFKNYAPEKIAYATERYEFEALRHWGIVDARLARSKYLVGDTYTVVDMALWGWARLLPNILGEHAAKLGNVKRLVDEISARPAAQKAIALKDRHAFKTEMDDEAKRAMFPHNYRAQARA